MNLKLYGNAKEGFHATGESDAEHLEPCPFCRSNEVLVMNTHSPSYWAECQNCRHIRDARRAVRPLYAVRAFREAVTLWDERAEENWTAND